MIIKKTETLESSHFSTGNGGMTFEMVRATHGSDIAYYMVHELSHYGVKQTVQIPVNDLAMMDEMIGMMQRTRAAMAPVQSYYQTSRIYRQIIDGVPVVEPEPEQDAEATESMCDTDMCDATDADDATSVVTVGPNVRVGTFGQFSKAKPPTP